MSKEISVRKREFLECVKKKINKQTVSLNENDVNAICNGESRIKLFPPYVSKNGANDFFKQFYLSVSQPNDENFLKIIHKKIKTLLQNLIPPDMFATLTTNQLQIPAKQLHAFFKIWENDISKAKKDKKERKFLQPDDMKKYVDSIQKEIDVWIMQKPKQSCCSLKSVEKYYINRHTIFQSSSPNKLKLKDDDLMKELFKTFENQQTFLLVACPDMGKSILWQYLAFHAQKTFSDKLVYMFYMNNIRETLPVIQNMNDVSRIFEKYLSTENCDIFRKNQDECILFFDAFDELSSENMDAMFIVVDILTKNKNLKLFISSRQRVQKELERILNVKVMSVDPLNLQDKFMFFRNFLNLTENYENLSKLIEKNIFKESHGGQPDFFGTPLLMRMLSNFFLDLIHGKAMAEPSIINDNIEEISNHLILLYEKFVEKSLNETYNKFNNAPVENTILKQCREALVYWEKKYQKIAFDELMPDRLIKLMCDTGFKSDVRAIRKRIVDDQEESLLIEVLDNCPRFTHKSYTEFLAAKYLYEHIFKEGINDNFCHNEIIEVFEQHETIRLFFLEMVECKHNERQMEFVKRIGTRAVFWACQGNHINLVKYLYENGDYSEIKTGEMKDTIFHVAIQSNAYKTTQFLLGIKGMNVNTPNAAGITPLHLAIRKEKIEFVKLLINKATMNSVKNTKSDIIHIAINFSSNNIIEYLIAEGLDINHSKSDGTTPLHLAIKNKKLKIVQLLIENNARTNCFKKRRNNSILHFAARCSSVDIIAYLIEKGFYTNKANLDNDTPLHIAIWAKQYKIVRLLIKNENGSINDIIHKKNENNLLHFAAEHGSAEILKYLIDKKVDINYTNSDGETPLQLAIKMNEITKVEHLVKGGALKLMRDINILSYAMQYSSKEIVQYLYIHSNAFC